MNIILIPIYEEGNEPPKVIEKIELEGDVNISEIDILKKTYKIIRFDLISEKGLEESLLKKLYRTIIFQSFYVEIPELYLKGICIKLENPSYSKVLHGYNWIKFDMLMFCSEEKSKKRITKKEVLIKKGYKKDGGNNAY